MAKDIYDLLASKGRNGDTELAHITKEESNILKMLGGSGTTNPWTGLPEYHMRKKYGITIPGWLNSHNKKHNDGTYVRGHATQADLDREKEQVIEQEQEATLEEGKTLLSGAGPDGIMGTDDDTSGQTIGEMGLGQEALTAEQYQGMTPQDIVDDIFAKQYNNQVPPDMDMSEVEFKQHIAGLLKNMPQFQGVDPEELGFLGEAKDLAGRRAESAWDATKYGLQGQAGKVGSMLQSGYGGGGVGMRGAIGAQGLIGKGFGEGLETRDIALDTADLGYRQGVYGLEQQAGTEWETGFKSFLGRLPSPA